MKKFRRRGAGLIIAWVIVWLFLAWQVVYLQPADIFDPASSDFIQYWGAARLILPGNNPYSPEQLLALQKSIGYPTAIPLLMWNPPWTLIFIIPFGLLSFSHGRLLWLIFHFAGVLFCADWIWRFYGGPTRRYWIAWVVSFTFLPSLLVLSGGQITPLMLLGLVGFMSFQRRRKYWWAGVASVLIAIKPQLFYLFWVALLLWSIHRRSWSALVGGIMAGLLTTLIPLLFNPALISQYLDLYNSASQLPFDWATPTFGGLLRLIFGVEKYWLQFLPLIIGILWFLLYWQKKRRTWDWYRELPLLLLVSLGTTSHAFTYDQVLLLPALIQVAVWIYYRARPAIFSLAVAIHLGINGLALVLHTYRVIDFWYIWMVPALLLAYCLLLRQMNDDWAKERELRHQPL